MGKATSKLSRNDTNLPRVPHDHIKFRVLIIGRANSGKTTILERVCESTNNPEVYRHNQKGRRERVRFNPTIERGMHSIEDELFINENGCILHDSRGFEAGSEEELQVVQNFVRRKSQEVLLGDRLHAIWYCIPMDNDRPGLDMKYFHDICPDKNVPVIALFTKYDQFRRNIKFKLEDQHRDQEAKLDAEVERAFNQHYLAGLAWPSPFIRLEGMHRHGQPCHGLIELTSRTVSSTVILLMLLAVQRDNLELNIAHASRSVYSAFFELSWSTEEGSWSTEEVIKSCIAAFPSLWFYGRLDLNLLLDRDFFDGDHFKILFSTLSSFIANRTPSISNYEAHHAMIVTLLILDCTCLYYTSSSRPGLKEALNRACSDYIASHIHDEITQQFTAPPWEYLPPHFTEFVLQHRLR